MNPTKRWPELPYDAWKDTYATLHRWMQMAGKVALAQAPPLNHSWGVAMQVTPRGIATRTLPQGQRSFTIGFTEDTVHASYDPDYANRFWRLLVQVERVLGATRCSFIGKASPVHFFW